MQLGTQLPSYHQQLMIFTHALVSCWKLQQLFISLSQTNMLVSERDIVEWEKRPPKLGRPSCSFLRTVTQTLYNWPLFGKLFRSNILEHICSKVVLLILTLNREKLKSSMSH